VTESVETGTGEITLIPNNEDDRIAGPSAGIHDCTDGIQQKRIARRNQGRHLGEIARIVRSGRASVHVIALIGADPDVIRNLAASQIRRKLAEIDNIGYTRRITLHIQVGDERSVLAFVELVAAGVILGSGAK